MKPLLPTVEQFWADLQKKTPWTPWGLPFKIFSSKHANFPHYFKILCQRDTRFYPLFVQKWCFSCIERYFSKKKLQVPFFLVLTSRTRFRFTEFQFLHKHKKWRRPLLYQVFTMAVHTSTKWYFFAIFFERFQRTLLSIFLKNLWPHYISIIFFFFLNRGLMRNDRWLYLALLLAAKTPAGHTNKGFCEKDLLACPVLIQLAINSIVSVSSISNLSLVDWAAWMTPGPEVPVLSSSQARPGKSRLWGELANDSWRFWTILGNGWGLQYWGLDYTIVLPVLKWLYHASFYSCPSNKAWCGFTLVNCLSLVSPPPWNPRKLVIQKFICLETRWGRLISLEGDPPPWKSPTI